MILETAIKSGRGSVGGKYATAVPRGDRAAIAESDVR